MKHPCFKNPKIVVECYNDQNSGGCNAHLNVYEPDWAECPSGKGSEEYKQWYQGQVRAALEFLEKSKEAKEEKNV